MHSFYIFTEHELSLELNEKQRRLDSDLEVNDLRLKSGDRTAKHGGKKQTLRFCVKFTEMKIIFKYLYLKIKMWNECVTRKTVV